MKLFALAATAMLSVSVSHAGVLAGVTGDNEIVTFDTSNPGTYLSSSPISGTLSGNSIFDLTYNSDNSTFYGLDTSANLYSLSLDGNASLIAPSIGVSSFDAGFAYDPALDALIFLGATGSELAIIGLDGMIQSSGTLSIGAGDVNEGTAPSISALGIDPVFAEAFMIDAQLDVLLRSFDPTFGEAFTVGALGIDVTAVGDLTVDPDGNAFAVLSTDGFSTDLYSIDTATGAATNQGSFPGTGLVAVTVPEPSSSLFLVFGGLLLFRRNRK